MSFIKKIFMNELKKAQAVTVRSRLQPIAWPSESMAQLGPIATGSCKREIFYKVLGMTPTEPMSVRGTNICEAGNLYEDYYIDKLKKNDLYEDSQVEICFPVPGSKNSVIISGRMDVIIKSKDTKIALEIKSVSGYKAPSILGTDKILPLPAANNLMQAMIYKYYLTNTEEGKKLGVQEVYLAYINRSDNSMFFYKVDLDEQGYPIITAIDDQDHVVYTLKLQEQKSYEVLLMGTGVATKDESRIAELRINIHDVFNKFDLVYDYTNNQMLPPPDYKIVYDEQDIEREYKLGRLGPINYGKAKKGKETFGDNKCEYCSYRKKCLEDSGVRLK